MDCWDSVYELRIENFNVAHFAFQVWKPSNATNVTRMSRRIAWIWGWSGKDTRKTTPKLLRTDISTWRNAFRELVCGHNWPEKKPFAAKPCSRWTATGNSALSGVVVGFGSRIQPCTTVATMQTAEDTRRWFVPALRIAAIEQLPLTPPHYFLLDGAVFWQPFFYPP